MTDINATKTTWTDCMTLLKWGGGGIRTSPDTQRPLLDTIPKGLFISRVQCRTRVAVGAQEMLVPRIMVKHILW